MAEGLFDATNVQAFTDILFVCQTVHPCQILEHEGQGTYAAISRGIEQTGTTKHEKAVIDTLCASAAAAGGFKCFSKGAILPQVNVWFK